MTLTTEPAIRARGLYHIYRERDLETVALRGADLDIERGTWTSLTGPSGSGKSTLVHVVAGLLEPSGGSVLFEGRDITRLEPSDRALLRRRSIGVVLQRDNLHPLLDLADNVMLPLQLDRRAKDDVQSRSDELIERVGLTARKSHRPQQLSGGEAQRGAIAVALAPRPPVLVADELTGELDEATAAEILDLLTKLRDEEGTAILTVTHNAQVAARADRKLVMRDGLVVDDDR